MNDALRDPARRFNEADVEYVLIGGMAVMLYGSSLLTRDVDFCAPMTPENIERLLNAIEGLNAKHFTRPDLPVIPNDPQRLRGFKNLYLRTDLGKIDILGELPGVGTYEQIKHRFVEVEIEGVPLRVLDLETLIESKRFAGRERDHHAISHLEQVRKNSRPDGPRGSPGLDRSPPTENSRTPPPHQAQPGEAQHRQ